jgi:hypothetical protein
MPEHPGLNQMRKRVEESSDTHRSVIAPKDNEIHKGGHMNDAERRRVIDESAALLRRALDGA